MSLKNETPNMMQCLIRCLGESLQSLEGNLKWARWELSNKQTKKKKWARWCYKRLLVFVFQYAICHKRVLWTYDTSTTNGLFLNLDIFNCDFFMLPLKLMALSLFNILRRIYYICSHYFLMDSFNQVCHNESGANGYNNYNLGWPSHPCVQIFKPCSQLFIC